MTRSLSPLVPLAAVAVWAGVAQAAPVPGPIAANNVWSRPETAGLPTGVAYLTLTNHGRTPDALLNASTPKAGKVGVHRSVMTKGIMSMVAVDALDLPPGRAVVLAPGGYHLMLEGLKGGLKLGESYPLTLRFAHAKPMTVQVQVRQGAQPASGMMMR